MSTLAMRAVLGAALLLASCGESPPVTAPPPAPPPAVESAPVIDPGAPSPSARLGPIPVATGTAQPAPIPPGPATVTAEPIPPAPVEPPSKTCTGDKPHPSYICARGCGPPVARAGDPPPPMVWAPPERVRNGRVFPCPVCLPGDARITLASGGAVAVRHLERGVHVLSVDEAGRPIDVAVVEIGSVRVGPAHRMIDVALLDGRRVRASGGHPTRDGRRFDALLPGDPLDGSRVATVAVVAYAGARTFDLLPAGPTGAYWADGVLVGSTLAAHAGCKPIGAAAFSGASP